MSMKEEREPIRSGAQVEFALDDDGEDGLSLQDIEVSDRPNSAKKSSKVKDFIAKKRKQVENFNVKEFVDKKQHELELFSMEEFNNDNKWQTIKAGLGEMVVTTLFIFIVCAQSLNVHISGHAESESLVVSGLTTGFCAVALIYSFADVSGAHFNPAVTFATMVTRKTTVLKGLMYMGAQLVGSMLAMAMLAIAYPPKFVPNTNTTLTVPQQLRVAPAENINTGSAFFLEMVLSFILVYVIFATAFDTVDTQSAVRIVDDSGNVTDKKQAKTMTIYTASGNSKAGFAPLSIGLTLGFLCFLGGGVSGGAFNPARVFGSAITSGDFSYFWLYLFGDFIGAALAGLLQQRVFATVKKQ